MCRWLKKFYKDEDGAVLPLYAIILTLVAIPLVFYVVNIVGKFTAISEVQIMADTASLAASAQQHKAYIEFETSTKPVVVHVPVGTGKNATIRNICHTGSVWGAKVFHYDTTESEAWDKAQEFLSKNHMLMLSQIQVTKVVVQDNFVYPDGRRFEGQSGFEAPMYQMKIPPATEDSKRHPTITVTVEATYTPIMPFIHTPTIITKSSQSQMSYVGTKQTTNTVIWGCNQPEPNPFP